MKATDSNAIIKEIVINASAERIFEALADPLQRVKWWGIAGKFQATHMDSDLRMGGAWQMRGSGPGGKSFTLNGEYRSVQRPHLLEMTWLDDGQPNVPATLVRFELHEENGATTVRLTHSGFTDEQSKQRYQGWPWLLTLLRDYVEGGSSK